MALVGEQLEIPLLSVAVLLPLALTPLTFLIGRKASWRAASVFSHAVFAIPLGIMLWFLPSMVEGAVFYESYDWVPFYGLKFSLVLDSLSYPFALLVSLMGILTAVYSHKYMEREHSLDAYMALNQLFMAGMLGVVLVSNLFLFYIFWELMLIPSYALIAYWGTGNTRLVSFKYFVFTHAGALSLLIGIAWLAALFGNLDMFELADMAAGAGAELRPVLTTIAILIFIGVGIKMAVFPFHSWLPDAYAEAPTPVSVMLSAAMTKSGVYAFARLITGILPFTLQDIGWAIAFLAVINMVWGGMMSMVQNDVKRLLAYSSISQMGYIVFGLATATAIGLQGGIFQTLNHGFAKALLFMAAGTLIYRLGERDITKLGGLASRMPVTAIAIVLGGLSVAGTPPLGTFISEWMIFSGGLETGWTLSVAVAVFATAITVGYYLRLVRALFFGEKRPEASEAPSMLLAPMAVLMFLVVILGFLNAPLLGIIARASIILLPPS